MLFLQGATLFYKKENLFCVKLHVASGHLQPALTILISKSKLNELRTWLHCSLNHSPCMYVETSFQGSPDHCTGVATSHVIPSGPRFIASSKTHLKDLCQTLRMQSLFQKKDFHRHWRWAPWAASFCLLPSQPCLLWSNKWASKAASLSRVFLCCFTEPRTSVHSRLLEIAHEVENFYWTLSHQDSQLAWPVMLWLLSLAAHPC